MYDCIMVTLYILFIFFFFQAEDGIRDLTVTGVQTCALPISGTRAAARGGFTAVCCMPNTKPVNDNASVTRFILDRAREGASARVWPVGAADRKSGVEGKRGDLGGRRIIKKKKKR